MIGRIVRPVDFERVLAAPQRSRSTHFAVHYLPGSPLPVRPGSAPAVPTGTSPALFPALSPELSTAPVTTGDTLVDDCSHWVGLVVPKRHAKRAVSRSLLKRQLRAAMQRQGAALPAGLWVLRLRAPFDRTVFVSPASDKLRDEARDEIAGLLERAATTPLPPRAPRPPRERGAKGTAKGGEKSGANSGNPRPSAAPVPGAGA